ncbi:MAG: DUF881 domain-containing protein [Clostridia bacterium]|nr:DUF881 domain-containing protein [Clostridia bacterium]
MENEPRGKKKGNFVIVGILAILIGIVLAIQIQTTSGSDQGGLVPLAKLKGYEAELKKARDERESAMARYVELEEKLTSIEKEKAEEDTFVKNLVDEIEKNRMAAGLVDVMGPGVIVTINDPKNVDEYQEDFSVITFNYELLLSLVNKMKEAGAEAVSINEQRIVPTTEISLAGSHININGTATAPPYTVKAIGNPETLKNALNIRGGVIQDMKLKYGLTVGLLAKDEMTIPRYAGVIEFKYAKTVPAEDESRQDG